VSGVEEKNGRERRQLLKPVNLDFAGDENSGREVKNYS
jgi:hypothetical protein